MPWKEVRVLEQRVQFVTAYHEGHWPLATLCRAFGISRKTGYKFVERYADAGVAGLADRSRAPRHHPNAIAAESAALLLAARRVHPSWGPRKLLAYMARRHPTLPWPAASSVSALFRRQGLSRPRRRRQHAVALGTPRIAALAPNALWTADFKGCFRARNGERCDPLTIADAATRYLFTCRLLHKLDAPHVQAAFERVFRTYGLPVAVLTDNGPPFAAHGLGGLTRLAVWWIKLGILVQRSRPGCPQDNGRHERVHLTLQQTVAQPPRASRAAQQRAFTAFRQEYNHERPHAALDNRTPAELYTASPRPYPARVEPPTYPPSFEVRRVHHRGYIKWRGDEIYVSEPLIGERIGLCQVSEEHWTLHFGPLELATLNDRTGRILRYRTIRYVLNAVPGPSPMSSD